MLLKIIHNYILPTSDEFFKTSFSTVKKKKVKKHTLQAMHDMTSSATSSSSHRTPICATNTQEKERERKKKGTKVQISMSLFQHFFSNTSQHLDSQTRENAKNQTTTNNNNNKNQKK